MECAWDKAELDVMVPGRDGNSPEREICTQNSGLTAINARPPSRIVAVEQDEIAVGVCLDPAQHTAALVMKYLHIPAP